MKVEMEVDVDDGSYVDMISAIDGLWKRFRPLDFVGKRALKSKDYEIAYPTTTSMCLPPEKLITKEGFKNKGKKQVGYDVYRDPSYHDYVDQAYQSSKRPCTHLSESSRTSKKQSKSNKQPTSKNQFIHRFPNHIRPYIEDVVNVASDGKFRFRVIASLHGYSEDSWPMVRRDLDNEIRDLERSSLYENLFRDRLSEMKKPLMISTLGP